MWSLGKVIHTPEVPRVYIGSFWDQPYQNEDMAKLFEAEQKNLLSDLLDLPRNSAVRKVNELVKRARLVRTHALILSHLREKMPVLFGKDSAKAELIANLDREYREIERISKVPLVRLILCRLYNIRFLLFPMVRRLDPLFLFMCGS